MHEHHSGTDMTSTAAADLSRAQSWAEALEDHTAKRDGLRIVEARPIVAREIGVAPGTLENLRSGRLKGVGTHIYRALQRATMKRLEAELRRIQHEIDTLKATGVDPRSDEMASALADRMAVRRALGLAD